MERSILKLPLSKLCGVPFAPQNRALFKGEKGRKGAEKGEEVGGGQQRGQKGKQGRKKTGQGNCCNCSQRTAASNVDHQATTMNSSLVQIPTAPGMAH